MAEWLKTITQLYTVFQRHTLDSKTYRLSIIRWIRLYHAICNQKRVGMAILISDFTNTIVFMTKSVTRDKGDLIMIKGSLGKRNSYKQYMHLNVATWLIPVNKLLVEVTWVIPRKSIYKTVGVSLQTSHFSLCCRVHQSLTQWVLHYSGSRKIQRNLATLLFSLYEIGQVN